MKNAFTKEDGEAARLCALRMRRAISDQIKSLVAEGRSEIHATRILTLALGACFQSAQQTVIQLANGKLTPNLAPPTPDALPDDL